MKCKYSRSFASIILFTSLLSAVYDLWAIILAVLVLLLIESAFLFLFSLFLKV